MIVVLDTNVLVSGLLTPFGPSGEIVRMASSGELTLCLDARILSEYRDVLLRPKFNFNRENVSVFLDEIERQGMQTAASPLSANLPDRDDEPFLQAALAGGAERLVSGNLAHFPGKSCQGMIVVSPGDFLAYYKKRKKMKRE